MPDRDLVGFVHNPQLARTAELVASLRRALALEDTSWVASAAEISAEDEALRHTSVVVTAGGDGTILRVVQAAAPAGVPILGINMGRVGFMAELSVDEAAERIPWYLEGGARVEQRMMLWAHVAARSNGQARLTAEALNDVVVSRGTLARLIDIDVAVDESPLASYRADGVITSTPTGSTGYALSAGGPIMHPEAEAMLIQPLAAHIRSLQTGLIVPGGSVCEIGVAVGNEAVLSLDSLTHTELNPDEKVVIERSPHVARFLRADSPSAFYAALTDRLGIKHRAATTSES